MEYRIFYRRHLPHYQPPGATLFVTFRLAGSIPKIVLQQLMEESNRRELEIANIPEKTTRREAFLAARKLQFAKWDSVLDAGHPSPLWLAEPSIANMVCEAIHYLDRRVYDLESYSIMPNHVHIVFTPLANGEEYFSLTSILKSLKGFSGRQANKILNREGAFWQAENYDHVVRDNAEFARIVNYVRSNPEQAGLPARWVYCREP